MGQNKAFGLCVKTKLLGLLRFAALTVIVPVLLVSLVGEALEFARLLNDPKAAANKDFVSYWAAARLIATHRNPYDPQAAQMIERSVGFLPRRGITMRNPPNALALVIPLSLLSVRWAAFFWSLVFVVCYAATLHLIWVVHHRPPNQLHLLGWVFAAALSCFGAGQTSIFPLTGIALFVHLHRSKPFLAGMCVALCSIKPHLFLPFGAVLLLWAGVRRAWPVLLGAGAMVTLLLAVVLPLDPAIWTEYFELLRGDGIATTFVPVLGALLRLWLGPHQMWLQCLPAPLGIVWAIWYYRRHREDWDWRSHGSLVLLVSLMVSPYAWFYDEIVVLPAVLHGLYASQHRERAFLGFGLISSAAMALSLAGAPLFSGYYLWTTTAWLGWYLFETAPPADKRAASTILATTTGSRDTPLHSPSRP